MFEKSYKLLLQDEGGYSNDPADRGGETYKGIARNYNPKWAGWEIIDTMKIYQDFPKHLKNNPVLETYVRAFYRKEYWNYFSCEDYPFEIAYEIFEMAVNLGKSKAVEFIQAALNVLNKNESLYKDIKEDGQWGNNTKNTLLYAVKVLDTEILYKVMNILQGMHYLGLMRKNKNYEKFVGWFNRVRIN